MNTVSAPAAFFFTCCMERVRKGNVQRWCLSLGGPWRENVSCSDLYRWCFWLRGWLEGRFLLGKLYIFLYPWSHGVALLLTELPAGECLVVISALQRWQHGSSPTSRVYALLLWVLSRVFLMPLAIVMILCKWWFRFNSVLHSFYLISEHVIREMITCFL